MSKVIYSKNAPEPVGPYSQAIQFKDLVFVSGQIALDSKTGLLFSGKIEAKVALIFENISAILSEVGMNLENIIKVEIFLTNIDNFPEVNKVYAKIFSFSSKPARTVVEVSRLPCNVDLEISCIAGI